MILPAQGSPSEGADLPPSAVEAEEYHAVTAHSLAPDFSLHLRQSNHQRLCWAMPLAVISLLDGRRGICSVTARHLLLERRLGEAALRYLLGLGSYPTELPFPG